MCLSPGDEADGKRVSLPTLTPSEGTSGLRYDGSCVPSTGSNRWPLRTWVSSSRPVDQTQAEQKMGLCLPLRSLATPVFPVINSSDAYIPRLSRRPNTM